MSFAAIVPALISGATSLIGSSQQQAGNAKAARLQMIAQAQATQERNAALEKTLGLAERGVDTITTSRDAAIDAINKSTGVAVETLDGMTGPQLDAIYQAAMQAAGYINSGTTDANAELRRVQNDNAGGMAYLREIVGNPQQLTPYQLKQQEEAQRVAGNTIRSSSLAGSGRTTAALLKNVNDDYSLKAQEQNRQAAMQAAGMMAGNQNAAQTAVAGNLNAQGVRLAENANSAGTRMASILGDTGTKKATLLGQQGSNIANVTTNAGQQISQNLVGQGSQIMSTANNNAQGTVAAGTAQGNAATSNANLTGQAVGAVGAAIADAFRGSKYGSSTSGASTISSGTGGLY